jgi:hypothetical protein
VAFGQGLYQYGAGYRELLLVEQVHVPTLMVMAMSLASVL